LPDGLYFRTKNPNLDIFCRASELKNVGMSYARLEYFTAAWYQTYLEVHQQIRFEIKYLVKQIAQKIFSFQNHLCES
jgi:hypothetical protein